MQIEIAYIVTELSDPSCPPKFPGASTHDLERIARNIFGNPENAWQRSLQQGAMRCAALADDRY